MSDLRQKMIAELYHNMKASGNKQLEIRLADTALWFEENRRRIPPADLQKRHEFLETGFWCLLEINALLLARLREKTGSKTLFLPTGMMMDDKEFT